MKKVVRGGATHCHGFSIDRPCLAQGARQDLAAAADRAPADSAIGTCPSQALCTDGRRDGVGRRRRPAVALRSRRCGFHGSLSRCIAALRALPGLECTGNRHSGRRNTAQGARVWRRYARRADAGTRTLWRTSCTSHRPADTGAPVRWIEDRSRNTHENALRTAAILRAEGIERVVLVAHSFDMLRARAEFAAAGLATVPAATGIPGSDQDSFFDYLPSIAGLRGSYFALYEILANLVRWLAPTG
ncbi:MAG: YdcF family protein [Betaproteobacteria bacterium]|nr:MAG: YdcF family protein [Betaproteobacteria bacterium]